MEGSAMLSEMVQMADSRLENLARSSIEIQQRYNRLNGSDRSVKGLLYQLAVN